MCAAASRQTAPPGAWEQAVAIRQAELVTARVSAGRLADSAVRLTRAHERLKASGARVDRGRQRRNTADTRVDPEAETVAVPAAREHGLRGSSEHRP